MIQDEAMIVEEIVTLTSLLGGTIEKYEVTDSKGNAYKKIIIEYDIQRRDKTTSQET